QGVLHRGVAEEQFTRRIEQRYRVFQMFNRRLQVCFLARQERAIGGQLLADSVEEITELAELVAGWQIQCDTELACAETGEAAAQNGNRSQQELRKDARDEDGNGQCRRSCKQCVVQ